MSESEEEEIIEPDELSAQPDRRRGRYYVAKHDPKQSSRGSNVYKIVFDTNKLGEAKHKCEELHNESGVVCHVFDSESWDGVPLHTCGDATLLEQIPIKVQVGFQSASKRKTKPVEQETAIPSNEETADNGDSPVESPTPQRKPRKSKVVANVPTKKTACLPK